MRISDWSSDVCSSDLQWRQKRGKLFCHAFAVTKQVRLERIVRLASRVALPQVHQRFRWMGARRTTHLPLPLTLLRPCRRDGPADPLHSGKHQRFRKCLAKGECQTKQWRSEENTSEHT